MKHPYPSRQLLTQLVAGSAACILALLLGCQSSDGLTSNDPAGQTGETPLASITPSPASSSAESIVPSPSPTAVVTRPGYYLLYEAGPEEEQIYRFDFADRQPVAPGDLVPGQPLSPDQERIATTTRPESNTDYTRSYAVLDLEQGALEPLPLIAPSSDLFWSPDDRRLMYASYPENRGQLVVYDFEKGENIVLVDNKAVWKADGWSPDGKMAAFVGITDGQYDLYLLDVGSRAVRRLTNTKDIETAVIWSPVSNELLVGTTDYSEHALEMWPYSVRGLSVITSDGQQRDLGRYDFLHAPSLAWSADGQSIAYSEKGKLCVLSLSNGQRSCPLVGLEPYGSYYAAFGAPPVWSPDDRWLAFRAAGHDNGRACDGVYALEMTTYEVLVVEEGICGVGSLTCPEKSGHIVKVGRY